MDFAATATIDLGALAHNFSLLKRSAEGCRIMAVVKANAYGHGLVPIARALPQADSFAVARVSEAQALRDAGIQQSIVLLEGVFDSDDLTGALALDCELVVHTSEQIDLLAEASASPAVIWIKVDTGMNRLGFQPAAVEAVRARLQRLVPDGELRLMTHFASADLAPDFQTNDQLERLGAVLRDWEGAVSVANSPASLTGLERGGHALGERPVWIRPGIALYGISPFAQSGDDNATKLQAVMDFSARIISVRTLSAGERVGYGGRFRAERAMRIGIVAAGYGDGYPRMLPDGTPVLVDGRASQLVGRVSMDMLAVDLSDIDEAGYGSEVLLWGAQLPVNTIAGVLGTIGYELVTRVSDRVTRRYVGAAQVR